MYLGARTNERNPPENPSRKTTAIARTWETGSSKKYVTARKVRHKLGSCYVNFYRHRPWGKIVFRVFWRPHALANWHFISRFYPASPPPVIGGRRKSALWLFRYDRSRLQSRRTGEESIGGGEGGRGGGWVMRRDGPVRHLQPIGVPVGRQLINASRQPNGNFVGPGEESFESY